MALTLYNRINEVLVSTGSIDTISGDTVTKATGTRYIPSSNNFEMYMKLDAMLRERLASSIPRHIYAGIKPYSRYKFNNNVFVYGTSDTVVLKSDLAGGYTEVTLGDLSADDQMYWHQVKTNFTINKVTNMQWYVFGWANAASDAWFDPMTDSLHLNVGAANTTIADTAFLNTLGFTASREFPDSSGRKNYLFMKNFDATTQTLTFQNRYPKGKFPDNDLLVGTPTGNERFACYIAGAFDAAGTYDSTAGQEGISIASDYLNWLKEVNHHLWSLGIYGVITVVQKTGDHPNGQCTYTLKTAPGYLPEVKARIPVRKPSLITGLATLPGTAKANPTFVSATAVSAPERVYNRDLTALQGHWTYGCVEGLVWYK